jgi:hypothetical protein
MVEDRAFPDNMGFRHHVGREGGQDFVGDLEQHLLPEVGG